MWKRAYHHALNPVFERAKEGFLPFLSGNAVRFIKEDQQHCLDRVNALIRGTRLETQPISRIIQVTATDLSLTHLYNYASQAWNNDFFLSHLSKYQIDIPPATLSKIQTNFGSVEQFQKAFLNHAEFLFGNGWTWLIRNEEGTLQIVNTSNGSSPIHHASIVKKDPLSIPSLLGQRFYPRIPLLCLCLWQNAYLPDYGMKRGDYVGQFFHFIDWQKVDATLSIDVAQ